MRQALHHARSECLPGIWYSLHRFTVAVLRLAVSSFPRLLCDLACNYETNCVDSCADSCADSCNVNVIIAICNARCDLPLSLSRFDVDPVIMIGKHAFDRRELDQNGRVWLIVSLYILFQSPREGDPAFDFPQF
jgi:hypothetical protein